VLLKIQVVQDVTPYGRARASEDEGSTNLRNVINRHGRHIPLKFIWIMNILTAFQRSLRMRPEQLTCRLSEHRTAGCRTQYRRNDKTFRCRPSNYEVLNADHSFVLSSSLLRRAAADMWHRLKVLPRFRDVFILR